ncbi:M23 family metallopeptidase [Parabacteroides sp. AD58]|uniref:M23 family metallopeptidase n=1 Tax=Parabacteroides absconsus TaxID=2951805 RepID=A0ABZ2IIZ6_9BACT|nr:M23 family metallopeptidase [Parabacteroides sp. AD58]MCM6901758.1 M23 family metallopeptidase [Parabacteroides sp. AD58]
MTVKSILSVCLGFMMLPVMKAEEPEKKAAKDIVVGQANMVMEQHVSELMAERVGFKKDIAMEKLAEASFNAEVARESLMFPAEDLYGSNWNTKWVDPFRGEAEKPNFPDSCAINCSSFVYPIDTIARVTSKYGPRRRRMHRGIDLKVQKGDTIRAAFDGKVRIRNYERRGYGYYLVIRHPNGLETIYGHLSKQLVHVNDIVHAGDPIGLGGNTGRSTGSHLHFETRFLGQAINPAEIVDFENGVPVHDTFVFRNVKINGRKSNIYTSSGDQLVYHRVKSGDTLGKIARIYGTSVSELCRLNGIKPTTVLRVGQSIRCNAGASYVVKKKKTAKPSVTVEAQNEPLAAVAAEQNDAAGNQPIYHKIQSGDTLGAIAQKYGTTVSKLCELNGITRTTILRLGRTLRCS